MLFHKVGTAGALVAGTQASRQLSLQGAGVDDASL